MTVNTMTLGRPVNRTAAKVIGRGVNHSWGNSDGHPRWDAPPPTRPIDKNTPDYRGCEFGRMTVVGLLLDHKGKWLCRCACGMYEPRTAKAIKNPGNSQDSCIDCRTLYQRRRRAAHKEFFDKHGVWPQDSSGTEARRLLSEWGG